MGVRGLSSFFNMNPELSKPHQLHDTVVILDGNNLLHLLYFVCMDCTYGGDYNRFASSVKKYFSSYLKCNIRPIVIFDGGYDKSDRKLHTTIKRAKQRLAATKFIGKHGNCYASLLPILAMEMFKDVIQEIGITFAQCDFEADDQITAIANHYKCPVISQDSDFYIFDVCSGFIRLDSVETTFHKAINSEGKEYYYLNCKIYFIDNFLSFFPGIEKSCLPLFGTLIGNDYVHINTFQSFFMNIKLPKFKSKSLKVNKRYQKMVGLLAWLKHNSLEEGIQRVLQHLKKTERDAVKELLERVMSGYNTRGSNLIHYLDMIRSDNEKCEYFHESKLLSFYGKPLPVWFAKKFQQGDLSPFLLNVVGLHRVFHLSQIEDTCFPSSYSASLSIRKVLYGLLLSSDDSSHNTNHVEEYDRLREAALQKIHVEPTWFLEGFGKLPELSELHSSDSELSELLIIKTLGEDQNYLKDFPDNLQLLVACIRFWLRNSDPKPTISFYNALVITIVFLNIVDPQIPKGSKDCNSSACNSTTVEYLKDVPFSDIINDILLSNVIFFSKNIKKFFQKPIHNNAKPIVLPIVHSFSQLQTCLLFLLYLNKLLGSPFSNTRVQTVFNGTLLYNMARELMTRPSQDLFISEFVGKNSVLDHLFTKLKNKILENLPPNCLQSDDPRRVRKKKKKKSSAVKIQENIVHVSTEDEDEDQLYISNKFVCLDISFEDSEIDSLD